MLTVEKSIYTDSEGWQELIFGQADYDDDDDHEVLHEVKALRGRPHPYIFRIVV